MCSRAMQACYATRCLCALARRVQPTSPCATHGPCLSQAATGVLPAVNQLEFHPWVGASTHETVQWCQRNGARQTGRAARHRTRGHTGSPFPACAVVVC